MTAAILTNDREIRLGEVPEPHPKDGQVLIHVHWASICGTDLHIYLGEFKSRVRYPRILGHEFSGIVESVGKDVSHLRKGDRVVVDPIIWCNQCPACLNGHHNACHFLKLIGVDVDGAFSEYVVADADKAFKIPEGISLRDAVLIELYSLGVHSTRKAMIEPGDRVVILGAGRLGLSVLEVLKQTGASWVCSVDILENRLKIAKKLGGDLVIHARQKDLARPHLFHPPCPEDRINACRGPTSMGINFPASIIPLCINGDDNALASKTLRGPSY
jgi:L-gulonate 5-dehydrogenase